MSALASSAAAAAGQQAAASPLSQSQPPAQSFSDLHNSTQAPAAAAAAADMQSQSLTQHLSPPSATTATQQQFFDMQAVQQRLTAACANYSEATAALQKAIEGRERFVNSGSKQGGSKQLPAKLDWKLCKSAHLSSDAVPAGFYASDQATLRAIEREATDKAYDALLAAKDKHITFLKARCVLRDFVNTTVQDFLPALQRIAAEYNQESQADAFAPSQADFSFPLAAVTAYFRSELQNRLTAQTLAAVGAKQREEQRIAQQRTDEHKSQEIVLAGAATGKTISMLAEKEVLKHTAPLLRELKALRQQLSLPQPRSPQQPPHANQQPRHRAPHSDASSSQFRQAQHDRNANKSPSRLVVVRKQTAPKRSRDVESEDDAIEQNPPAPSHGHHQRGANKRHKLTVTFKPKNGEGGDRPPRSDQQQRRSSKPANAPHQHNARNQGRGPRSDIQQPQPHQPLQ